MKSLTSQENLGTLRSELKASFKSVIEKFGGDMWGLHFKVTEEVAEKFIATKVKRILVSINGSDTYHAGIMHLKTGITFINVNKVFCKKHQLNIGDHISVEITQDMSKYGMEMPEELEVALSMDPEADCFFHALTPGKQRNLIYFSSQTKSSNIRARRAWVVCDHLKLHGGNIDFKDLNQEIKIANNDAKLNG